MFKIKKIKFRFYGYLNDFIDSRKKKNLNLDSKRYYIHFYQGRQTIKDRIESLGIPHPEVALILKNGQQVDFSYLVQNGDFFAVYPYFYQLQLAENKSLINSFPGKPRFILDVHLGKLARYLRRFGFDTAYSNSYQDQEIVELSLKEKRIILSRDLGLLMRKRVKWGKFIQADDPKKQLQETAARFKLKKFYQGQKSRCVDCNTKLIKVEKEKILSRLEPLTKKYYDEFRYCSSCEKIYWKGSHYQETEKLFKF